jgi:DNA-directed RNA polymerase subunit L/DNA-directed RNA polymerase alpha subunit
MFSDVKRVDSRTYTFRMSPFHVTYANTLRRAMLVNVETIAFNSDMTDKGTTSDVVIVKNDTPMTNEMLADRVGLIPIHVRDPLNWDADRYIFTLNVTNNGETTIDVTASDFVVKEVREDMDEPVVVDTAQFFPPNPITKDTCLLAILKPKGIGQADGESISLTAKATIGNGRKHARHIPVSQCTYSYTRDTDPERVKEFFEKWLVKQKKINPRELEADGERKATLEREFNTMEVARCFVVDERGEPSSFDFVVESVGVLEVPYILRRACDVIESICIRYSNIAKGDIPDELTIQPADGNILGFDFLFKGHDHTLGNLIQTWIVDELITKRKDTRVNFAGYKVPHPLRDEMVIRIGVTDGQEATARAVLEEAARGCAAIFQNVRDEWMRLHGKTVTSTAAVIPGTADMIPQRKTLRIVRSAAPAAPAAPAE